VYPNPLQLTIDSRYREGAKGEALSSQGRPVDSLNALASVVISRENVDTTTQQIAELAVEVVSGCDYGGISLVRNGQIKTMGATDRLVEELDAIQYEVGEGPCLSSIKEQASFHIDDMCADETWPEFSARACREGMGGLLSFVLKVSLDSLGALNLYSRRPNSFTEEDFVRGALFATYAAVALANAQTHAHDLQRVSELEEGLHTRDVIGTAMGIIMERDRVTSAEAFQRLREQSQSSNNKIRSVAEEIVAATEETIVDPRSQPR
jgi:ANTAR domain/GAF domain